MKRIQSGLKTMVQDSFYDFQVIMPFILPTFLKEILIQNHEVSNSGRHRHKIYFVSRRLRFSNVDSWRKPAVFGKILVQNIKKKLIIWFITFTNASFFFPILPSFVSTVGWSPPPLRTAFRKKMASHALVNVINYIISFFFIFWTNISPKTSRFLQKSTFGNRRRPLTKHLVSVSSACTPRDFESGFLKMWAE